MHLQRATILGAAGLGASATFMPWVSMPETGPITGATGLGWIFFLLFVVAAVAAGTGDRYERTGGLRLACALVPGVLAGALGVVALVRFRTVVRPALERAHITIGIGPYVVVAAAVAMLALAFVFRARDDED